MPARSLRIFALIVAAFVLPPVAVAATIRSPPDDAPLFSSCVPSYGR
jgi:hypothetical protein